MDLLSKGYTPDQSINAFVVIVLGDGGSIEVELQDHVVGFEHALETGLEDVAFFEVYGSGALDYFKVEGEG